MPDCHFGTGTPSPIVSLAKFYSLLEVWTKVNRHLRFVEFLRHCFDIVDIWLLNIFADKPEFWGLFHFDNFLEVM